MFVAFKLAYAYAPHAIVFVAATLGVSVELFKLRIIEGTWCALILFALICFAKGLNNLRTHLTASSIAAIIVFVVFAIAAELVYDNHKWIRVQLMHYGLMSVNRGTFANG